MFSRMQSVKKLLFVFTAIIGSALMILLIYVVTHVTKNISVSSYLIDAECAGSFRVVQLTDLHNAEFGEDNSKLVEIVEEQKPDLIVMTGDMINKDDDDLSTVCSLIEDLSEIADVYYGMGNHEVTWMKSNGDFLKTKLQESGAEVLDVSFKDISIKGNDVRIGGYMGYYGTPHMTSSDVEVQKKEVQFMRDFEETERFKILLNHIPTSWVDWKYIDQYPVDLVLCGHYHGGQMNLPFWGPLYAPYVGWRPENVKGMYIGKTATCILSTGLGSEYHLPRLNNPPEIVVIDIE